MWKPVALIFSSTAALASCAALVLGPERERAEDDAGATGSTTSVSSSDGGGGSGGDSGSAFECAGGRVIWVRHFPAPARQDPLALEIDGEGGVFLAGEFEGALDLGGGSLAEEGGSDIFLARFDGAGHHRWSKRFGDTTDQNPNIALKRTPDGGVLFAGSFAGTVDFGNGAPVTAGGNDAFVSRYDADGNHAWTWKSSGSNTEFVKRVDVDEISGMVVLAGGFTGKANFGGPTYTSQGTGKDAFVVQIDSTGSFVWGKSVGSPGNAGDDFEGNDSAFVAVDQSGRIVLAGSIAAPGADLGTGYLTVAGDAHSDAFAAVYQPDGTPVWTNHWGDGVTQDLRGLALDPSSATIVLVGRTDGTVNFGGGDLVGSPVSPYGLFLAKLDANGGHVASAVLHGLDTGVGLSVGLQGDVVIASSFDGNLALGGEQLQSAGKLDGLVVGLDAAFGVLWSMRFGSTEDDDAVAVAVDDQSNVFVAGYFQKTLTLDGCPPLTGAGDHDVVLMKLAP